MRKTTILLGLLVTIGGVTGCQKDGIDDDTSFLSTVSTANANKLFEVTNDNSGKVSITPTGEGASSYLVKFGHGTGSSAQTELQAGQSASHVYPEGSYTVTIVSRNLTGDETSATYPLQVTFRAPEDIEITSTTDLHNIKVKATAKYASSYLVYFDDVANETGTPMAASAEVQHTYTTAGTYNVKVVALSGGAAKSEKTTSVKIYDPFGLPITFDDPNINYFFGTFGDGQQFATVDNPSMTGMNTSAKVGKFTRGAQGWSGTYSPLNAAIDMSMGKKIKVLAYNPDPALVGKSLNVELEAGSSIKNGVAILKKPFTMSGAWEELEFDFSTIPAIPVTEKFSQLVLRFNDATDGAGAVIYVDNFRQTN